MQEIVIRPNKQRALLTLLFISILLTLQVISNGYQFFLFKRSISPIWLFSVESYKFDTLIIVIDLISLLVYFTTIVFYVLWFRRAYFNLNRIAGPVRYKNIWAGVAWFIPIFHWIGPFHIMYEMYAKARNYLHKHNIRTFGNWVFGVLSIWWCLYFISGAKSIYSMFQDPQKINTLPSFIEAFKRDQIHYLIQASLTIFAILAIFFYYILERRLEQIKGVRIGNIPSKENELIDTFSESNTIKDSVV